MSANIISHRPSFYNVVNLKNGPQLLKFVKGDRVWNNFELSSFCSEFAEEYYPQVRIFQLQVPAASVMFNTEESYQGILIQHKYLTNHLCRIWFFHEHFEKATVL